MDENIWIFPMSPPGGAKIFLWRRADICNGNA